MAKRSHAYQLSASKHPRGTHANAEPISHVGKNHPIQHKVFHKTRKKRLTQTRHRA